MAPLPPYPDSVSGCTVLGTLREGPAAAVLRARDSLGLPVELHLFVADVVTARIPREIFFDEVRRTAAIHTEHIGAVVNAGEKGPWLFVAQKATDGASLAQIFSRGGAMDEARALHLFAGVADGLSALELAGLRHGGIEPRTVALPGGGQVLLSLRRLVPTDLAARDPRYLAPEEARGQDGSIASDLYATGLLLFEALLGEPVLSGTPDEVRTRLARAAVPDPAVSLPGIHGGTVEVLRALLAANPSDRPRTAAEAASRLRAARAGLDGIPVAAAIPVAVPATPTAPAVAAPPPPPPVAPPQPPRAAVAAAAALRPRRAATRLVYERRGVPVVHELLDPITWVGFGEGGLPVARAERFPGATAQVEVGAEGAFLFPTGVPPGPRVNGREVQRHDLRVGDRFTLSGTEFLFEKAGRLSDEDDESSRRLRRPARRAPGKGAVLAGVGLSALAFGWGVARWASVQRWRGDEHARAVAREREIAARIPAGAAADGGPAARVAREEQAVRLLEDARAFQRAGDATLATERLRTLSRDFADTAAAAAAAHDGAGELDRARDADLANAFADVQARADALAAEGLHAQAEDVLLAFARAHPDTLVADRAERAARAIMRTAEDGVLALLDRADEAVTRQDWATAVAAVDLAVRTATRDTLDRAQRERDRVYRLRPRVAPDAPGGRPTEGAPPPGTGPDAAGTGDRPPAPPTGDAGRSPDGPAPATRDDEAQALFRASREAATANRLGEAERGFYRLLAEYADTAAVRNYGNEIRDRLEDVVKKGRGVAGLLHGQATWQGNRVTLTYEWENAAEAGDWEPEYPFMVPNRGTFVVEKGDVTARGAAAFLHRARFLPASVSMTFRLRPGIPPQDMGALFMEPKDLMNHLMFTVGNQFFTIGKGAREQKAPGNVIWVFGKGMWRDTDPNMVGYVRTGSSEEPRVASGKWVEIEVAKERGNARFVVGGRRIDGKAVGDNRYEITGVRPGLYVLLSEARFDDVVIEGEIDPTWVAEERARVFPAPGAPPR